MSCVNEKLHGLDTMNLESQLLIFLYKQTSPSYISESLLHIDRKYCKLLQQNNLDSLKLYHEKHMGNRQS
jgi:hypothetical protein